MKEVTQMETCEMLNFPSTSYAQGSIFRSPDFIKLSNRHHKKNLKACPLESQEKFTPNLFEPPHYIRVANRLHRKSIKLTQLNSQENFTPKNLLEVAIELGSKELITFLVEQGYDTRNPTRSGISVSNLCVQRKNLSFFEHCSRLGVINKKDFTKIPGSVIEEMCGDHDKLGTMINRYASGQETQTMLMDLLIKFIKYKNSNCKCKSIKVCKFGNHYKTGADKVVKTIAGHLGGVTKITTLEQKMTFIQALKYLNLESCEILENLFLAAEMCKVAKPGSFHCFHENYDQNPSIFFDSGDCLSKTQFEALMLTKDIGVYTKILRSTVLSTQEVINKKLFAVLKLSQVKGYNRFPIVSGNKSQNLFSIFAKVAISKEQMVCTQTISIPDMMNGLIKHQFDDEFLMSLLEQAVPNFYKEKTRTYKGPGSELLQLILSLSNKNNLIENLLCCTTKNFEFILKSINSPKFTRRMFLNCAFNGEMAKANYIARTNHMSAEDTNLAQLLCILGRNWEKIAQSNRKKLTIPAPHMFSALTKIVNRNMNANKTNENLLKFKDMDADSFKLMAFFGEKSIVENTDSIPTTLVLEVFYYSLVGFEQVRKYRTNAVKLSEISASYNEIYEMITETVCNIEKIFMQVDDLGNTGVTMKDQEMQLIRFSLKGIDEDRFIRLSISNHCYSLLISSLLFLSKESNKEICKIYSKITGSRLSYEEKTSILRKMMIKYPIDNFLKDCIEKKPCMFRDYKLLEFLFSECTVVIRSLGKEICDRIGDIGLMKQIGFVSNEAIAKYGGYEDIIQYFGLDPSNAVNKMCMCKLAIKKRNRNALKAMMTSFSVEDCNRVLASNEGEALFDLAFNTLDDTAKGLFQNLSQDQLVHLNSFSRNGLSAFAHRLLLGPYSPNWERLNPLFCGIFTNTYFQTPSFQKTFRDNLNIAMSIFNDLQKMKYTDEREFFRLMCEDLLASKKAVIMQRKLVQAIKDKKMDASDTYRSPYHYAQRRKQLEREAARRRGEELRQIQLEKENAKLKQLVRTYRKALKNSRTESVHFNRQSAIDFTYSSIAECSLPDKLYPARILLEMNLYPSEALIEKWMQKNQLDLCVLFLQDKEEHKKESNTSKNLRPALREVPQYSNELRIKVLTELCCTGSPMIRYFDWNKCVTTDLLRTLLARGHYSRFAFVLSNNSSVRCTLDTVFQGLDDLMGEGLKQGLCMYFIVCGVLGIENIRPVFEKYLENDCKRLDRFHVDMMRAMEAMMEMDLSTQGGSMVKDEVFVEFTGKLMMVEEGMIRKLREEGMVVMIGESMKEMLRNCSNNERLIAHSLIIKCINYSGECYRGYEKPRIMMEANVKGSCTCKNEMWDIVVGINYLQNPTGIRFTDCSFAQNVILPQKTLESLIKTHTSVKRRLSLLTETEEIDSFYALYSYFNHKSSTVRDMLNEVLLDTDSFTFSQHQEDQSVAAKRLVNGKLVIISECAEYPEGLRRSFSQIQIPNMIQLKESNTIVNFPQDESTLHYTFIQRNTEIKKIKNETLMQNYVDCYFSKLSFSPYALYMMKTYFRTMVNKFGDLIDKKVEMNYQRLLEEIMIPECNMLNIDLYTCFTNQQKYIHTILDSLAHLLSKCKALSSGISGIFIDFTQGKKEFGLKLIRGFLIFEIGFSINSERRNRNVTQYYLPEATYIVEDFLISYLTPGQICEYLLGMNYLNKLMAKKFKDQFEISWKGIKDQFVPYVNLRNNYRAAMQMLRAINTHLRIMINGPRLCRNFYCFNFNEVMLVDCLESFTGYQVAEKTMEDKDFNGESDKNLSFRKTIVVNGHETKVEYRLTEDYLNPNKRVLGIEISAGLFHLSRNFISS